MKPIVHSVAFLTLLAGNLSGQLLARLEPLEVVVSGIVAGPHSTVMESGVREDWSGLWFGAAIEARHNRWLLVASGLRGTLRPLRNTVLEREAGEQGLLLRYQVRGWAGLEASYTARAFSSSVGYQRWRLFGLGGLVTMPLGEPTLQAFARATYFPATSAAREPSPVLGLAAEVGASLDVPPAPVQVRLAYRFERYDFPVTARRLEEFDRIALQVSYRVRRGTGQPPIEQKD